jgi:hypothetical protein
LNKPALRPARKANSDQVKNLDPSSGLRFAEHKADTLDRPIPSGRVTDAGPAGYPRGCEARRHRRNCRRRSLRAERLAQAKLPSGKLPDRAWRFGPTAALSGRGDQFLGDAGRVERSGRHRRIVPAPVASSRGLVGPSSSRIRRHRWLQANELPDAARRLGKRQVSSRKKLPRSAS